MESYTVYTYKDHNPLYSCPRCETIDKAKLAPIQVHDKWTIEFMCTCGCNFAVSVEHRDFYRKRTNLEGSYVNLSNGGKNERIQVLNLSIGGIGFTTRFFNAVSVDDRVKMYFILDDKKRSIVRTGGESLPDSHRRYSRAPSG